MKHILVKLWKDESGVTAIEYGLIAGLVAAVLVVVLGAFGDKLKELFDAITGKIEETTDTITSE
jgi:pilus assembly protein Flp/PilA